MYNLENLLIPFMVSGIIGTTLSLTLFSIFQNSEIFRIWGSPKYLNVTTAGFFVLSYLSTLFYIIFQIEFLLIISLIFLLTAGIFILLSIIYIFRLHIIEKSINRLKETKQLPELFGEK